MHTMSRGGFPLSLQQETDKAWGGRLLCVPPHGAGRRSDGRRGRKAAEGCYVGKRCLSQGKHIKFFHHLN